MFDHQAVEKLEEMSGNAEPREDADEIVAVDAFVEEIDHFRSLSVSGASFEAVVGDVIKRLPGPVEAGDEVLLIEAAPFVEFLFFAIEVVGDFGREKQLEADAGMFEKLVVEHRPEEVTHAFWQAVDHVGLVDAIDEDEHIVIAKAFENALQFHQHFVAVVAAIFVGSGLAGEIDPGEAGEHLTERVRQVIENANLAFDAPGFPEEPDLLDQPGEPAGDEDGPPPPVAEGVDVALVVGVPDGDGDGDDGDQDAEIPVPAVHPGREAELAAEVVPARVTWLVVAVVVVGSEHQEIAFLVAIELLEVFCFDARGLAFASRADIEDAPHETGDGERENGIHVVPQTPMTERPIGILVPAEEAFAEGIEKGIEVVVFDDEDALVVVGAVVVVDIAHDLQPEGRFTGSFLSKNDGGRGLARVAGDFIPGRVVGSGKTVVFEDVVALRVFLAERILADAVMFEKELCFHLRKYRYVQMLKCALSLRILTRKGQAAKDGGGGC